MDVLTLSSLSGNGSPIIFLLNNIPEAGCLGFFSTDFFLGEFKVQLKIRRLILSSGASSSRTVRDRSLVIERCFIVQFEFGKFLEIYSSMRTSAHQWKLHWDLIGL